jgi:hypothetical protein
VKAGGAIFHCFPMCVMNHGFWNEPDRVQGLLFAERMVRADGGLVQNRPVLRIVPEYKTFAPEQRMYTHRFAVRPKHEGPMKFPTQQKYLRFRC